MTGAEPLSDNSPLRRQADFFIYPRALRLCGE